MCGVSSGCSSIGRYSEKQSDRVTTTTTGVLHETTTIYGALPVTTTTSGVLHETTTVYSVLPVTTTTSGVLQVNLDILQNTTASMDQDVLHRAKIVRRTRKSAVTRLLGTIDRHILDNDVQSVTESLEIVKQRFENLEEAHDAYHAMLTNDDEIENSEEWFISAQRDYVKSVASIKSWINNSELELEQSKPDLSNDIDNTADLLAMVTTMPRVEIDKFDGDPLKYQSFMAIFDELVHAKQVDDQVKLTRLLQYTKDAAKNSISSCALIGGTKGYQQARDILKTRFGSRHLISQSVIDNLKSGKPINKGVELQQLADDLTMAATTLDQLGTASELQNQRSIIEILQRCPKYVQFKWRKQALKEHHDHERYPNFQNFVEFIRTMAIEACDPLYGNDWQSKTQSRTKGSSYSGSTNSKGNNSGGGNSSSGGNGSSGGGTPPRCAKCSESHTLFQCEKFKALSPRDRREFISSSKLCFNCFENSHFSPSCPKKTTCSVCNQKHSKWIHIDRQKTPAANNGSSNVFGYRWFLLSLILEAQTHLYHMIWQESLILRDLTSLIK